MIFETRAATVLTSAVGRRLVVAFCRTELMMEAVGGGSSYLVPLRMVYSLPTGSFHHGCVEESRDYHGEFLLHGVDDFLVSSVSTVANIDCATPQ